MLLSEHDLKQLDEETIGSLQTERLRTLSLKLLADLKEARDRLNQSPENSSRPPSSRAPWERASSDAQDESEQEEEESAERARKGEQPGRKTPRAWSRNRVSPPKRLRASLESPRERPGMGEPSSWR